MTEQNKNVENNLNQMWIKGTMNKEGFFTLSNSGKFLSVISRVEDLEMKGIHFKLKQMFDNIDLILTDLCPHLNL